MPRTPATPLELAAFLTVVLVLGMNFIMVRWSNEELEPFWGAALRYTLASTLLVGIVLARGGPMPKGRALAGTVLYGFLQFGLAYALLYWALVEVAAGTSGILFSTIPLLTLLLAVAAGLERLSVRNVAGALIVVAGIAAVFWDQASTAAPPLRLAAVLGGALAGAAASVVVKRAPRVHPMAMNGAGMVAGAALLLAGSALAGEAPALPTRGLTWLALAWLVMSSIVGFVLFVWLLGRWDASRVSYAGVLAPVVAVVSGAVLAGERLGPVALAGGAVVLGGVYVGALSRARAPPVSTVRTSDPPTPSPPGTSRAPRP